MSFPRPFQWYHYHADLVWQDGIFNIKKHVKYPARQIRQVFYSDTVLCLYFPYVTFNVKKNQRFATINDLN
jgi:hypothetical protein